MNRYTEIVILCEDRQQEIFARHFLVNCGVNHHRITVKVAPKGVGAGEQYVREQYPKEVGAYRRRPHLNIALVVVIDADTQSVAERFQQLESELISVSLPKRQLNERIAIFVPKRNIETWIHYLQGEAVDETKVYHGLGKEGACKPLVAALARNRNKPLQTDAPPSLQTACNELRRILSSP